MWWRSSATASNSFVMSGESVVALDAASFALNGTTYTARLDWVSDSGEYQLSDAGGMGGVGLNLNAAFTVANSADPRTNSWFTANAGKYARIYTTDANKTNGVSVTTWSNGSQTQATPAYAGVQDRTRALLAGYSSHLPKPIEPAELAAVVANLAGRTARQ